MLPFTLTDYSHVEPIVQAVTGNLNVRYVKADGSGIRSGSARRFCTQDGTFMSETDLRDGYVEVVSTLGTFYEPVRDLMDAVKIGAFAIERSGE